MSLDDGYIYPSCIRCGKKVGILTADEAEVFFASDQAMLCFDCDGDGPEMTPDLFLLLQEGERLSIDGLVLEVLDGLLEFFSVCQPHAHARASARGLSSSTYLNECLHKWVVLKNLVEYVVCPECHGHSAMVGTYGGDSCGKCNDFGSIPVWVDWVLFLVNGVRENA